MINLDNKKNFQLNDDQETVLQSIKSYPLQLKQALEEILRINLPKKFYLPKKILVCGMGGSRFPSLIIKNLYKESFRGVYEINDDYRLPFWVDEDTLVVLSSYSGTTEEVINAYYLAKKSKALIFSISSGGELKRLSEQNGDLGYFFNPVHNPSKQPRIGVGYLLGSHLGLLVKLNFIKNKKEEFDSAFEKAALYLKKLTPKIPLKDNLAKKLAKVVFNHHPHYVVSEFLTGIGNAIANQTNETAKSIASFWVIPELNHHLMEGLKNPRFFSQGAVFVFFYSLLYNEAIKKRFQITKEVIDKYQIKSIWFEVEGKTPTQQAINLIGFSSFYTFYLSVLYQENPAVIPYVDYFKKRLKE